MDHIVNTVDYMEETMPVIPASAAVVHQVHGSSFHSYVTSAQGATQLRSWRLEVPADSVGVAHRPTCEEVLLVLAGRLLITLDGVESTLGEGDVLLVPADAELQAGSGPDGAAVWVTTTTGMEAVLADGSRLAPPWAA